MQPTTDLVRDLLAQQHPALVDEPVRPSPASGSSNWVFRIGEGHAVRLPRADSYVPDLLTEARRLPLLAPALPVPVPEVLRLGDPTDAWPRPWTVVTWVPGDTPRDLDPEQQRRFAEGLGAFLVALHGIATPDEPAGPERWGYRCGEPVTPQSDAWLEEASTELADLFDPEAVRLAWSRLRDVPTASSPPCWVHTDLSRENLLAGPDGGLAGVVDFGGLGIGDASVDLLYAWELLDAPGRDILRRASGADDATWLRARAWAFVGPGLLTLASYRTTMPERTARLTRMVEAVAAEVGVELR